MSPALTSSSPRSFLNCSTGMTASDFSPTLTMTMSSVTSTTNPVRIIPGRMRWLARLFSNKSAKLSVIPATCTGSGQPMMELWLIHCTQTFHGLVQPVSVTRELTLQPQRVTASQCQYPVDHVLDSQVRGIDHV